METEINNENFKEQNNFIETINPATLETLSRYELEDKATLVKKLERCHSSYTQWSKKDLKERISAVEDFSKHLNNHKDEISKLMTQEMGKPIGQSYQEIDLCQSIIKYSIDKAPEFLSDEKRELDEGEALVTYRPQGVILSIQPWNFPLYQVIRYTIPNLLAGNTTLLSHSQCVWGTAKKLKSSSTQAKLKMTSL